MAQFIDSILESLTDSEKWVVERFFSLQQKNNNYLTRKYIVNKIKKVKADKSNVFSRTLVSRAFDELSEVLTSTYHLNNGNFSRHDRILLQLKKKILLARIISKNLNQNKMKSFKVYLNVLISEALKNEIYEVAIEALIIKKYAYALKEGSREFQKTNQLIDYLELCQKKTFYAADCYFIIVSNNDLLKLKDSKALHDYILKTIRILKADYKKFKSSQINYYLQIILMYYNEKRKKYNLASKYAKQIFDLVKNSPVLYREERLGFAMINLSQYKTLTGNYSSAAKYIKLSQAYYIESSNNYLISKNQEFLIFLYQKKYDRAQSCLNELMEHKLSDSGTFNHAKYIYYNAVLLFQRKEFKKSLTVLAKSLEIEKDKTRWNISVRVLSIMLFIELRKVDEAILALQSLRKYVERQNKTKEITKRDILIVKLLLELEKSGFDYDKNNFTLKRGFEKLSEINSIYSWQYFSSELIPFHEWVNKFIISKHMD
ncbi:MAG: hypothetical protein K0Q95_2372 [Bacteroidota bacterium]|jgi:hypothetical protein|nr:hypothetical protein [Bacteroidota bacterium]